jgi:uncharacterized protein (TIGR00369 family)
MSNPDGPWFVDAPIARTFGLEVLEVDREAGRIVVAFAAGPEYVNAHGRVQGGILATMLDATMGPALRATLAEGQWAPSTDLHVRFLAPAVPGRFVGRGHVVRRGGTIAFTEASLEDATGAVVATASGTSVLRGPTRD